MWLQFGVTASANRRVHDQALIVVGRCGLQFGIDKVDLILMVSL